MRNTADRSHRRRGRKKSRGVVIGAKMSVIVVQRTFQSACRDLNFKIICYSAADRVFRKYPLMRELTVGPFSSQRNGAARNSSKGAEHQRALDLHDKTFETSSFDARRYRKAFLSDNGPVIVIAIHQMNRCACLLRAGCEHGFMHLAAIHSASSEGGQERRVRVQDAVFECSKRHRSELPQVP